MSGREGRGRHLSGQQGGTTASLCLFHKVAKGGEQRLGKVENISLANFIMMQVKQIIGCLHQKANPVLKCPFTQRPKREVNSILPQVTESSLRFDNTSTSVRTTTIE